MPPTLTTHDGPVLSAPSRLAVRVHEQLRERIVTGALAQGERLPEARLARELDVSRVPLREALPRLEAEGFVTTEAGRGAVVRTWTARDVDDLFDVRLALEVAAAGHAARRVAAGASTAPLVAAIAASERALSTTDDLAIARASVAVHDAVVALSGNAIMVSMMREVSGRLLWLFHLTARRDQHLACAEHHDLAAAIGAGRPEVAAALVRAHVESGRAPTLAALTLPDGAAASTAPGPPRPGPAPHQPARATA